MRTIKLFFSTVLCCVLLFACSNDDGCTQSTFYKDADGDGFGDAASSKNACTTPSGYVADKTDTDDTNAAIFPGCTQIAFYRDADGDSFGNATDSQNACVAPDGYVADKTDPDDTNADLFPGCTETTYYEDADGDGFGNVAATQEACLAPEGYVVDNTDADDTNVDIFPGCTETTYYEDADGDGYGNPVVSQNSCVSIEGYVVDNTDADDTNADIFPGCTETTYYEDADGDGFGDPNTFINSCIQVNGYVLDNTDCNDENVAINPGVDEILNDGIDNNCDGDTGAVVWAGIDIIFTKAANADWTLPENQDHITANVVLTRQNNGPMYNYQWWQDTFGADAVHNSNFSSDLVADFWGDENAPIKDIATIMPTGGTKGVRWALLDDTGANNPNAAWDNFSLYGQLGDPTHFYSFNNLATIIESLENGLAVNQVVDDFNLGNNAVAFFTYITGKKLGVWLVEEDIYFTLTFTEWGNGNQNPGGPFSYTRSTPNN